MYALTINETGSQTSDVVYAKKKKPTDALVLQTEVKG